jgi:hypothetical protein
MHCWAQINKLCVHERITTNEWERLWIYSLVLSSFPYLYFFTCDSHAWTVNHILYTNWIIYRSVLCLKIHVLCDIMLCQYVSSSWCQGPLTQRHTAQHHTTHKFPATLLWQLWILQYRIRQYAAWWCITWCEAVNDCVGQQSVLLDLLSSEILPNALGQTIGPISKSQDPWRRDG